MSEEFADFVGNMSDDARTSLYYADSIARGYGITHIDTEYLLLGILAEGSGSGAKILASAGITLDRAERALSLKPGLRNLQPGLNTLSEPAIVSLKMAWRFAQEYGSSRLGTEHILHGLLAQQQSKAAVLLKGMGIDVDTIVRDIEALLDQQSTQEARAEEYTTTRNKYRDVLRKYGTDLVTRAKRGKLDPVVGRAKEVERLITILSRRRKNNPVLIGEPGVGKTAIVEGLALRIAKHDVPEHLYDAHIVQLDLASIIAGTKYRGEFEERIKRLLAAIKHLPDTIVFIDELHLLVGAGSAEGSMDAANLLKPALARGEVRLIGATTFDEYKKHIEKDSALERRFQAIVTKEPSLAETKAILRGLRDTYEKHHSVTISDEVLEDAVYLADRYIKDRSMPDKAIDIIDEAAALVRVRTKTVPEEARKLAELITETERDIEDAVSHEEYKSAAMKKTQLLQYKRQHKKLVGRKRSSYPISANDIAQAVSNSTGIPVTKLQKNEQKLLANLEQHIAKRVIGQREAIEKVARAIRRSRSGVASARRPIGSFIFMGPTGVGKTELARVLATEVFGSGEALIKIDMSEFSEKHTASRLVGAPAGYVGYDDGGQLTDKIRRQPYSVILFDEIEKAHPAVFNLLLQLLEDGSLTDGHGRTVDFTNTIIILTSNLGAEAMQKETELGFMAANARDKQELKDLHRQNTAAARSALAGFMRPELINRFDGIVTFQALTRKEVSSIADLLIGELKERLAHKGISLLIKPAAKRILIQQGYSKQYGARELRRVIEDTLEHQIAEGIIDGRYMAGTVLTATSKKNTLVVEASYESS